MFFTLIFEGRGDFDFIPPFLCVKTIEKVNLLFFCMVKYSQFLGVYGPLRKNNFFRNFFFILFPFVKNHISFKVFLIKRHINTQVYTVDKVVVFDRFVEIFGKKYGSFGPKATNERFFCGFNPSTPSWPLDNEFYKNMKSVSLSPFLFLSALRHSFTHSGS